MTKLISTGVGAACTVAAALSLASPALAAPLVVTAPAGDMVVQKISFADLDLASAEAQTALNSRVSYGIRRLCYATTSFERSPRSGILLSHCRRAAWLQARPQISTAVGRAQMAASTGHSSVAAAAVITISLPLMTH